MMVVRIGHASPSQRQLFSGKTDNEPKKKKLREKQLLGNGRRYRAPSDCLPRRVPAPAIAAPAARSARYRASQTDGHRPAPMDITNMHIALVWSFSNGTDRFACRRKMFIGGLNWETTDRKLQRIKR